MNVQMLAALAAVVLAVIGVARTARALAVLRHAHPDAAPADRPADDERAHQALTTARLAAHFAAGGAFAVGVASTRDTLSAALIAPSVIALLALLAAAEVWGRTAGDSATREEDVARARRAGARARRLVLPWAAAAEAVDRAFVRVLPAPPSDSARGAAVEQFREIVAAEADAGGGEGELVAGVFTLTDTPLSDVMVPRVDVIGVPRDAPWAEVVARARSAQHSRLPVYAESIDDIVGVLYAKDLLRAVVADEPPDVWTSLVRPTVFVPTTKRVDDQLRDFRSTRNHLAVVVDEYGGTAGIVTIEDLLEEIVGEIRDERDVEDAPVESEDGCRYWVSGRLTLDDLSAATRYDFHDDEVATVGGLVYHLLGRVPRAGERLTIGPFRVVVERVVRRRIQRVYLERADDAPAAAAPTPAAADGVRAGTRAAPNVTASAAARP